MSEEFLAPVDNATISADITGIVYDRAPRPWWFTIAAGTAITMMMIYAAGYLFARGVGVWGLNTPIGWGFAITNFVWWIGIGHAGTLISAILLLLRQKWRTSINRFAEAMTLFAVVCAGMFPIFHLGRPQLAYWLLPYPDTMRLWPQFRSPLVWDVFAVSTYLIVSLVFWYVGLVPDVATMRDNAPKLWQRKIYGVLAMGWRGSTRHWHRHEFVYLLLAGFATPLVVSVHTVVSFDFAVGIIPGWHSTIFPPYFVAGAIYSGFAMVLTLMIPLRRWYHLEKYVTAKHLDVMTRVMLVTGLFVAYGYAMEDFDAFYSADRYETYMTLNRLFGPYAPVYWLLLACNLLIPQFFWIRALRRRVLLVWIASLIVNVGMWLERFIIVVTSLSRDFMPSSWGMYIPTRWDVMLFVGTLGFFVTLLCLFVRTLPSISMHEMRAQRGEPEPPRLPNAATGGAP